jgi:acyl carrier protein
MSSVDERINSVMLSFIRKRVPEADIADLETPMYDLDMDSLDVVDLSNALDEEYGVKADLERVSECITPSDLRAYFRELIDAT